MQKKWDILAVGVHDTKNQLFQAEAMTADLERRLGVDLGEVRYVIESAAASLSRTLNAYRLFTDERALPLTPVVVADLLDEVALDLRQHLARAGLTLTVDGAVDEQWLLDRERVIMLLDNALQNAGRYARQEIRLSATLADDGLCLRVEDDGPGFDSIPPAHGGVGLMLAERITHLHERQGRHGRLALTNGGALGGACVTFWLP